MKTSSGSTPVRDMQMCMYQVLNKLEETGKHLLSPVFLAYEFLSTWFSFIYKVPWLKSTEWLQCSVWCARGREKGSFSHSSCHRFRSGKSKLSLKWHEPMWNKHRKSNHFREKWRQMDVLESLYSKQVNGVLHVLFLTYIFIVFLNKIC